MSNEDPVRLKAGGHASPELVRALRALGDDSADAARLARVAAKLGATLADVPPPTAAGHGAKLIGAKTLGVGIAAIGLATAWFGVQYARHSADESPRPSATAPAPGRSAEAPMEQPATQLDLPSEPSPAAEVVTTPEPNPHPQARRPSRHNVRGRSANVSPSVTRPTTEPGLSTPAEVTTNAPVDEGAAVASQKETARPSPPKAITKRQVSAQPSEAALLFDARKTMEAQPLAALRLLDEHAEHFPNGVLAPEREVLRIEALRKLGRSQEAAQRLRDFESRYPDSIHLRRLQQQAATPR